MSLPKESPSIPPDPFFPHHPIRSPRMCLPEEISSIPLDDNDDTYVNETSTNDNDTSTNVNDTSTNDNDTSTPTNDNITSTNENETSTPTPTIIQQLNSTYHTTLLTHHLTHHITTRLRSHHTLFALASTLTYLLIGAIFFRLSTEWKFHESLLFSMSTITTVGYGHMSIPRLWYVQIFLMGYIFVGIALMTVLGLALREFWKVNVKELHVYLEDIQRKSHHYHPYFLKLINHLQSLHQHYHQYRQSHPKFTTLLHIPLPYLTILSIGAISIGSVEHWTFLQSIYFSVVSMTTIGYGDYVPTSPAGIWMGVLYVPCSVGFMSMYLGSVMRWYDTVSEKHLQDTIESKWNRLPPSKQTNISDIPTPSMTTILATLQTNSQPYSFSTLRIYLIERLVHIIATSIAGSSYLHFQPHGSLTLGSITTLMDAWQFPQAARSNFRVVALRVLVMVGERTICQEGKRAVLEMSVGDVSELMGPVVVSWGGERKMEEWLEVTKEMYEMSLSKSQEELEVI